MRTSSPHARLPLLPLLAGLLLTPALASAQPFADGPDDEKAKAPKPPTRTWTVKEGNFAFTFDFKPGVPDPGQVVEVIVLATEGPKTPHPRYGNRIPLGGATFTVEATNPAGESIGRFRAHGFALQAGRYGLHMTPTTEGLYALDLAGKTSDGRDLRASLKLPVAVWPLPSELEGTGADVGAGPRRRRPIIKKR